MTKKGIIGAGNWLVDTVKTLDRFPKEGELCNIKSIEIGGEGSGIPLQYSCLENPMDGGAWQAVVHGVAEGWTRLNDFTLPHGDFYNRYVCKCNGILEMFFGLLGEAREGYSIS